MADLYGDLVAVSELYRGRAGKQQFDRDVSDTLPDEAIGPQRHYRSDAWDREVAALRRMNNKPDIQNADTQRMDAQPPKATSGQQSASNRRKAMDVAMDLIRDPNSSSRLKVHPESRKKLRSTLLAISQRAEALAQKPEFQDAANG